MLNKVGDTTDPWGEPLGIEKNFCSKSTQPDREATARQERFNNFADGGI